MITIDERDSMKLPGVTSLFISFKYNQEIVDVLKTIDCSVYNKKTYEWEVPLSNLSYLIDNLVYIDDVQLNAKSVSDLTTQSLKPILKYKIEPFEHQMKGIEFGLNHNKFLLLDAPGLGKTAQIIHIAEELKEQLGLEHCFIISCVNSLKSNWESEIKKHSNLTCRILGKRISSRGNITFASIHERALELKNKIDDFFIITNIETFRSDEVVEAFQKSVNKFDMIVVDEVHKCKNKKSIQADNLLKLDSTYKIGATGTLLLNNPIDTYVPLTWVGANRSTLTKFKEFYCYLSKEIRGKVDGFKNLDILKEQIDSCSLRRTKDLLNLPEKTIIKEVLDMNDDQKKFYDDVKQGIKDEVDKVELTTTNLLALVTRLRQATGCPSVLTTSNISSTKVDRCCELVEEIVSNDEKVVIFSNFKDSVYSLQEKLKDYNPIVVTGDTNDRDVQSLVDLFQQDNEHMCFIATWQKMGTGFTLTKASYMIHIDTAWTYGLYEQTCDRIHRIGANKPVFIYNLICKDSIDERVQDILETKQAIGDYVIDDKLSDESIKKLRKYIENL